MSDQKTFSYLLHDIGLLFHCKTSMI